MFILQTPPLGNKKTFTRLAVKVLRFLPGRLFRAD
jgi:hypothetical protein